MMSLFNKSVDVNKYLKIGITAEAISFRGVSSGWTGCTMTRGSFHKANLATIDLSYLRLIVRLPALIFTSVLLNNFKTIVNPVHLTG